MTISVQKKKNRYVRRGYGPRIVRRTTLDGLTPTARSNHVRWFDPTVGRWLSEDPAAADENLYRYCGNAPTDGTDPSGLQEPVGSLQGAAQSTNTGPPATLTIPSPPEGTGQQAQNEWWSKYGPGAAIGAAPVSAAPVAQPAPAQPKAPQVKSFPITVKQYLMPWDRPGTPNFGVTGKFGGCGD